MKKDGRRLEVSAWVFPARNGQRAPRKQQRLGGSEWILDFSRYFLHIPSTMLARWNKYGVYTLLLGGTVIKCMLDFYTS